MSLWQDVRPLVLRLATSVGVAGVTLAACLYLPHVDHATVALLLVLVIVGLAIVWGSAEALTGAMVGGIGFDYYFLPPHGFGIANPDHWVSLAAFLVTAVVTGQLAARSKRYRIEAVEQHNQMEKLYRLVNTMLEGGPAFTLAQLADQLAEIFAADAVAIYDELTGQIVRSGPRAGAISDQRLHDLATCGLRLEDANSTLYLVPIRHGSELVGSIGMGGAGLSESLLSAIAGRVGMGLSRLYAIGRTTEAEAARRADELKSAVLDAMAHEIRNPLNSIKVAATTLLSAHAGSETSKREMLTIIDEEVTRVDRLLDEGVQMARLEASELSLKVELHNIASLIPSAIEELGPLTGRRPVQVTVPETLPAVECDRDMIARVLRQLLSNALKYSPVDSPVTVSAEFTGAAIVIDVVDSGPGVDEKERDRIFEKYYRGRAARLSTPGTGLGLASARAIVQAHGGEIWMTSPPTGGSAFHVSLPVTGASRGVGAP